eukprot:scaffold13647_cov112-Isochrysis_galbana.AAC.4
MPAGDHKMTVMVSGRHSFTSGPTECATGAPASQSIGWLGGVFSGFCQQSTVEGTKERNSE